MEKYLSQKELEHLNNCSGCSHCDYIMEWFGECVICNSIIDKQELYYDCPAINYYCDNCVKIMPDKNDNNYVMCGHCEIRDIRDNMVQYHENFDSTWTCDECVKNSVINNRWEIMIL